MLSTVPGRPAASQRRPQASVALSEPLQHDVDDGIDRARRQLLAAGDEVAGGVVDEHVERLRLPRRLDHRLDGRRIAHVEGKDADGAARRRPMLGRRRLEHRLAAAADA